MYTFLGAFTKKSVNNARKRVYNNKCQEDNKPIDENQIFILKEVHKTMCMTNQTIEAKAKEIKELLRMKEELETEIASLQDELKAELTERSTDELIAGEYKIRYKEVSSNRFDTTSFKATHKELYEQYTKTTVSRRFSIA